MKFTELYEQIIESVEDQIANLKKQEDEITKQMDKIDARFLKYQYISYPKEDEDATKRKKLRIKRFEIISKIKKLKKKGK